MTSLAELVELLLDQPGIADRLLARLPLACFASLAQACRTLRILVQQQPEHAWLARAQHYLPSHPLLQAASARAYLGQQRLAHRNLVTSQYAVQEVRHPRGVVRFCLSCSLH